MIAISLCVLLLATYCYSVPVTPRVTTPSYEFTTGQTIFRHNGTVNMRLVNSAESTGAPMLHKPRVVVASGSGEYTTSAPYGHMRHVPRVSPKSSVRTATMDPAESTFIHNFNKFQFTTMETKKQFQKKAIGGDLEELDEQEQETKREVQDDDLDAEQEQESKREVQDDDLDAEQEQESKRETQDNDSDAEQEQESRREVQDDDLDAEQEEESKREVQDDDLDAEQEEESKREAREDDLEEDPESKREVQDDDLDAEQEEESKREAREDDPEEEQESKRDAREDDLEEDQESKRDAREDDLEEEQESKRAIPRNSFEITTSAYPSGSSSAESFGKHTGVHSKKPMHPTSAEFTTSSSKIVRKTPVKVTGTKTSV